MFILQKSIWDHLVLGGWYEYTATTTSSEMKMRQTLQQESASQAASKLSIATKGISIAAIQAGFSKRDEVEAGSGIADMKKIRNGTMTSNFEYNCSGPTVYTMEDLIKNLKNPNNWSIFPSIANRSPKFKRVDDIIESQAAELDDDKELSNAAILLKQIINKGPEKAFQDEYFSTEQYFLIFTTVVGFIIIVAFLI